MKTIRLKGIFGPKEKKRSIKKSEVQEPECRQVKKRIFKIKTNRS